MQEERLAAAVTESKRLQAELKGLQSAHGELQISHVSLAGQLSEALAAQQAAKLVTMAVRAALADSEARHAASHIVASAVQKALAADAQELRERVR